MALSDDVEALNQTAKVTFTYAGSQPAVALLKLGGHLEQSLAAGIKYTYNGWRKMLLATQPQSTPASASQAVVEHRALEADEFEAERITELFVGPSTTPLTLSLCSACSFFAKEVCLEGGVLGAVCKAMCPEIQ